MITVDRLVKWMNVLRHERANRDRLLECFWQSQLVSKEFLCKNIPQFEKPANVVIHGAWYGTLAGLLLDTNNINEIVCVDIDPECERYVRMFNMEPRVKAVTTDMTFYRYSTIPDLIINTSCEHIDDKTYDIWLSYVPSNTLVVLQSNNMFRVKDHINCVNSLDEFELKCGLSKIEFADQIEFDNGDKRFMIMGYK